jgi:hypothetical protein
MKLLSIDVGMKCLAFCLFTVNSKDDYMIEKWDVLDLCNNKEYKCCGKTKKNNNCENNSKYHKNSLYYCKTHAKKQNYKIPANELKKSNILKIKLNTLKELNKKYDISNNIIKKLKKSDYQDMIIKELEKSYLNFISTTKTSSINLATYGYRLKIGFEKILDDYEIDKVIIENQIGPLALRMKTLQGMIMQHFIENNCSSIEEISAANKLKDYIPKKTKTTYSERKKLSILVTQQEITKTLNLNKWIFNFTQHKKKDDLADSFLQGLWYIKYKNYE